MVCLPAQEGFTSTPVAARRCTVTRKPEAILEQERSVQGMKESGTWYKPGTQPVKNLSHRCALLRREGALAARARPGLFAGFLGIYGIAQD